MSEKIKLVKNAMLAVQRYPWEQGVCAQALWELGDVTTAIAMAHDAVLRQTEEGRLAVITNNIAVTDPAANGEVVWRAYEKTGNVFYRDAANKMLEYLLEKAPRTDKNVICHNEVSFYEGYSPDQIWVDSIYMAPPFLAVMGEVEEAAFQIEGCISYLQDEETGLLYHIYDPGTERFVRKKLWATGNGWALLGIARVAEVAMGLGNAKELGSANASAMRQRERADKLIEKGKALLDAMLKYQLPDGRFYDILDDPDSFVEGTAAMMMAAFIYRGIAGGWLSDDYKKYADLVRETMEQYVDEFGLIHEVCGCPDFMAVGTSAESMAAYLMMHGWYGGII